MSSSKTVLLDGGPRIEDISFEVSFLREAKLRRQINTRIRNTLQRNGIITLSQLMELEMLPEGLGVVCHEAIRVKLAEMGLKFKARLG